MADTFFLKKGDRLPDLTATLQTVDGEPVNLGTATVLFRMRLASATSGYKVSAAATVLDAAEGRVSYSWQAADTDTAGIYYGEFVCTFPGGVQTVPNGGTGSGKFVVKINESVTP
jgi:hypothetical protein